MHHAEAMSGYVNCSQHQESLTEIWEIQFPGHHSYSEKIMIFTLNISRYTQNVEHVTFLF